LGTREEYLLKQKREKGKKLFGIFPAQYPKEILWAMNVLPVEIWDPPLDVIHANAHLQPYICSVVRLGLELVLQGKCDDLDGFLFPHTCDSIQNLAAVVYDYLGLKKPCYLFYHPRSPYHGSSRVYYLNQLRELVSRLEKQLGPLDGSELKKRVQQGQLVARVLKELYDLRVQGDLTASNADFYQIIRRGEYLSPDDFLPLLEEFVGKARGSARRGPAVILSGVLPNPKEILTLLDELGVRIAHDDLLSCSRRLLVPPSSADDPFEALTQSYFAMPPCTTKDSSVSDRVEDLLVKIQQSGAQGIIFYMVKFCEPELFDVPQLTGELRKRGVATLVIDCELNQTLSGQLATRVEAFVEMIS
jgi:benzoyl-CoA reductase/2-hydroxyglutaryl-CoA dehydratase subunit BcrC/BadD/HgdB